MSALEFDFEIEQGSDQAWQWPVQNGGVDVDLTEYTLRGQVRKNDKDATVLYEWSTTLGNATCDAGSFTIFAPAADSSTWVWRKGVYDIELTAPGGSITRVLEGTVEVDPEVTR